MRAIQRPRGKLRLQIPWTVDQGLFPSAAESNLPTHLSRKNTTYEKTMSTHHLRRGFGGRWRAAGSRKVQAGSSPQGAGRPAAWRGHWAGGAECKGQGTTPVVPVGLQPRRQLDKRSRASWRPHQMKEKS